MHCGLGWAVEMLRDVAMAINFGTQFAITGFVGYNFGCMIASDMLFDSRGGFSGSSYPMKTLRRSYQAKRLAWGMSPK